MVLITYIRPNSVVPETRTTMQEMLMAAVGYTSKFQNYSKGFFNTRTIVREPRPLSFSLHPLEWRLDRPFTKAYHQFRIPKMSGGTRLIKAPNDELKGLQKSISNTMQDHLKILSHDTAYAYSKGRCAYDALITHQRNNARWFLKVDIKDFFPTITEEVLRHTLPKVYPLNFLTESYLNQLIDIATDEGALPQGSPLSPLLSNLVMLEFDKEISSTLRRYKNQTYTYTRYADDMLITSAYEFKFQEVIELIEQLFSDLGLPFQLSKHKTRYASKAGRNWNLGLMYNQDQRITIGQKKKKELHSLVNSFIVEHPWDIPSTQELIGKLGYLKNVEPDYHATLINKYETKYSVNLSNMFKEILNGSI